MLFINYVVFMYLFKLINFLFLEIYADNVLAIFYSSYIIKEQGIDLDRYNMYGISKFVLTHPRQTSKKSSLSESSEEERKASRKLVYLIAWIPRSSVKII